MAYVKIEDGRLVIHPVSPEMGASYYTLNGYEMWTDEQVRLYQKEHETFDPESHTYSKYMIKNELENLGLWEDVKQMMITADFWEDFLLAQDLSFRDEKFKALYDILKEQHDNIDDVLFKSILI